MCVSAIVHRVCCTFLSGGPPCNFIYRPMGGTKIASPFLPPSSPFFVACVSLLSKTKLGLHNGSNSALKPRFSSLINAPNSIQNSNLPIRVYPKTRVNPHATRSGRDTCKHDQRDVSCGTSCSVQIVQVSSKKCGREDHRLRQWRSCAVRIICSALDCSLGLYIMSIHLHLCIGIYLFPVIISLCGSSCTTQGVGTNFVLFCRP